MEIHRIVNSLFNSCTYVLYGSNEKEAVIIDCGDSAPIIHYLRSNELDLTAIFITHTHFDHIYGLKEISTEYPQANVYTNINGLEGLRNPQYNLSKYHNDFPNFSFESDKLITITNGDILNVSGLEIKVMETPGHDFSCVSYQCGNNIFTGDSYIPGLRVVAAWPKSNKSLAKKNEDMIKNLEANGFKIYAGHKI